MDSYIFCFRARVTAICLTLCLALGVGMAPGRINAAQAQSRDRHLPKLPYASTLDAPSGIRPEALPGKFNADIAELENVNPIKDQGSDGTCWIFASHAALEGYLLKSGAMSPAVFSEEFAKCATLMRFKDGDNALGTRPDNVSGGSIDDLLPYWTRGQGPVLMSAGPPWDGYKEGDRQRLSSDLEGYERAAAIEEVVWINAGETIGQNLSDAERLELRGRLKQGIMDYGALYTGVNVSPLGRNKTGICQIGTTADEDDWIDHVVAIIGWDDEVPVETFKMSSGVNNATNKGAFLVRNSWGTVAGDHGYYWLSYDDALLGSTTAAVKAKPVDKSERICQNDAYPAEICSGEVSAAKNYMASRLSPTYEAGKADKVSAVSFYTINLNTKYSVYLSREEFKRDPYGTDVQYTGGQDRQLLASGTISAPGFHRVELKTKPVVDGDFTIIVCFERNAFTAREPLAAEAVPVRVGHDAFATSFDSSDGYNWIDIEADTDGQIFKIYGEDYTYGDHALKAYTEKVDAPVPSVEPTATPVVTPSIAPPIVPSPTAGLQPGAPAASIKLNVSALTLGRRETFALKATIAPRAASKQVTYSSSKPGVVSVSAGGRLTAEKVGSAVITATAGSGRQAKVTVRVKSPPQSVRLSKTKLTLKAGRTYKLRAILPSGSASYRFKWNTSNSRRCTVAGGMIKARKVGVARIKATTYNGKTALCRVSVVK